MSGALIGSDDGTMRCWEINTGRCVKNITVGEAVASLAWNPNPVFHVLAVAVDQRFVQSLFDPFRPILALFLVASLWMCVCVCWEGVHCY